MTADAPKVLRGARAIGEYVGMSAAEVVHRNQQRSLPIFCLGGCPHATTGALDEWLALFIAGRVVKVSAHSGARVLLGHLPYTGGQGADDANMGKFPDRCSCSFGFGSSGWEKSA